MAKYTNWKLTKYGEQLLTNISGNSVTVTKLGLSSHNSYIGHDISTYTTTLSDEKNTYALRNSEMIKDSDNDTYRMKLEFDITNFKSVPLSGSTDIEKVNIVDTEYPITALGIYVKNTGSDSDTVPEKLFAYSTCVDRDSSEVMRPLVLSDSRTAYIWRYTVWIVVSNDLQVSVEYDFSQIYLTKEQADALYGNKNTLDGSIQSINTDIGNMKRELDNKVNSTDYTRLVGSVNDNTTTIASISSTQIQQSSAINTNSSDIRTLKTDTEHLHNYAKHFATREELYINTRGMLEPTKFIDSNKEHIAYLIKCVAELNHKLKSTVNKDDLSVMNLDSFKNVLGINPGYSTNINPNRKMRLNLHTPGRNSTFVLAGVSNLYYAKDIATNSGDTIQQISDRYYKDGNSRYANLNKNEGFVATVLFNSNNRLPLTLRITKNDPFVMVTLCRGIYDYIFSSHPKISDGDGNIIIDMTLSSIDTDINNPSNTTVYNKYHKVNGIRDTEIDVYAERYGLPKYLNTDDTSSLYNNSFNRDLGINSIIASILSGAEDKLYYTEMGIDNYKYMYYRNGEFYSINGNGNGVGTTEGRAILNARINRMIASMKTYITRNRKTIHADYTKYVNDNGVRGLLGSADESLFGFLYYLIETSNHPIYSLNTGTVFKAMEDTITYTSQKRDQYSDITYYSFQPTFNELVGQNLYNMRTEDYAEYGTLGPRKMFLQILFEIIYAKTQLQFNAYNPILKGTPYNSDFSDFTPSMDENVLDPTNSSYFFPALYEYTVTTDTSGKLRGFGINGWPDITFTPTQLQAIKKIIPSFDSINKLADYTSDLAKNDVFNLLGTTSDENKNKLLLLKFSYDTFDIINDDGSINFESPFISIFKLLYKNLPDGVPNADVHTSYTLSTIY